MNKIAGKVTQVQSSTDMSIVEVDIGGDIVSALVLETPHSAAYLKSGNTVEVVFKETEVSIGKNLAGLISIRNNFKARIKTIDAHSLLATIVLIYHAQEITSIISTQSVERLDLKVGDEVQWLVKTNEVSLCPTT